MTDNTKLRIAEFTKFHNLLMANAPKNYVPWYLPIDKQSKAIDGRVIAGKAPYMSCCNVEWVTVIQGGEKKYKKTLCKECGKTRGSWKQPWARLTFEHCLVLIRLGYNIGLAAREGDDLVIIDIDNYKLASELPETLINNIN